jgi:hypothetical protein
MESESVAHSLIPRTAAPGYGGRKQEGESPMVTTVAPAEQRIVLQNISWQTFKAMLSEMGSERGTRLAYCEGTVEIMSPLMPHENSNRLIEGLVTAESF